MPMGRLLDRAIDHRDVQPGDVISIPFGGVLSHYGVVTARGTVISNSRKGGGVVEQSLADFGNGKALRLHRRDSDMPSYLVEARARRAVGASYNVVGSNCSHFVRHAHKRRATPLQIGTATLMAVRDMLGPRKRY